MDERGRQSGAAERGPGEKGGAKAGRRTWAGQGLAEVAGRRWRDRAG
ncbi:hypothetical protein GCM10009634_12980 [Saccharothrix xinjiangensis]